MAAANGPGPIKASNGLANGKTAAEAPKRARSAVKKRRGFVSWTLSTLARLATWFTILTILFRCPPTLDACDDNSPFVCKHYFKVKNVVAPHVQPYYDSYAAPYVDVAQPYYDKLNTHVIVPTRAYAVHHGAPWLEKGWSYGRAQWERNGQPQVSKAQALAQEQYDQFVAPHVSQAVQVVGPYYASASANTAQLFRDYILPGYDIVQPYAIQGYKTTSDFTTGTALPTAVWAWNKTYAFLDTSVWPQVRVAYLDNVEPQLVRIGERLGRYKTQVQSRSTAMKSTGDKAESSFSRPAPSSQTSSTKVPEPSQTDTEFIANPVEAPPAAENESDKRKKAREMVASDLELWQTKFAARADEGARDMEDRVDEIAKNMIESNAKARGRPLVDALEKTVTLQLETLKEKILAAVGKADESEVEAQQEATLAVRSAGVAIKEQAQAVRAWRQAYDEELQSTVTKASDIHFQLLDDTRNLALQQIGMKWAWADGVTYKDWAKYHELKSTLQEWTVQLKQLIVSHPSLLEAQDASAEVEDQSMEIASEAARELSRLKQVAAWKIAARDTTDNFDSEAMMLAAEQAEEAAQAAAAGPEEPVDEAEDSAPDAPEQAEDATPSEATASSAEESSASEDTTPEATVSEAEVPDVEDAEATILPVYDEEDTVRDDSSESASAISESSSSEADDATSVVSEAPSSTETEATEESETASVEEADATADGKDSATPSVKPAMFGAMAQAVPERKPVLEDYDDADAASSALSKAVTAASQRYSSASSVVSAQIHGTPKAVHRELFSSVSAAYENAVAAASSRFSDVVAAAPGIGKTPDPTPTATSLVDWSKVEAIAAQRLSEGRLWAEVQYQSAVIALGLSTPTPTPTKQRYLDEAKKNYYAGVGLAQERYSSFIAAASSAMFSLTATPTPTNFVESASSMASVARESAASAIQAAQEAAGSAYSAATGNVASAVQAVDDGVVSVFDAASEQVYLTGSQVAETWDNAIADINRRIYGEQKHLGWYDGLMGEASSAAAEAPAATASVAKQFGAVSKLVSELISGKEPSFTESVLSRLSDAYATATATVGIYASEASDKLGRAVSQATEVIKETMHLDRDEL